MGLDNSIMIERNEYSNKIKNKLKSFILDFDDEERYNFEVCYWRKCWNVREDISDAIGGILDNRRTSLNIDNLKSILLILKGYNKENWKYGGWGSIWTWEEHKKINKKHIKNLEYLIKLKKKYPDLEIYFLDSY